MHRRDFLKYLLATPIAAELDIEKLLWIPEKTIFLPTQAQLNFLHGIPYHQSNATTGIWLGFTRADFNHHVFIDRPDWRNWQTHRT